jgi:transposase
MATRVEWTKRVTQWQGSGLDAAEFARREGLDVKRLYWWRWKLRSSVAPPIEPQFLPVHVVTSTPPPVAAPIEIALPNGRVVRVPVGADPATLARVLAIAAEAPAC